MYNLSVNEQDLLHRINEKEELRPFFFRKAKGLKWFDSLEERAYFNPKLLPKPKPAKEAGYFTIPYWPVVDYLVNTAPELNDGKNQKYADKYLEILVNTTMYAKENDISNYRTWMQFAEIIVHIPYHLLSLENIDIIDIWLNDEYEHGIVAQIISEKLLFKLFQIGDEHALELSRRIIESLYKVFFVESKYSFDDKPRSYF